MTDVEHEADRLYIILGAVRRYIPNGLLPGINEALVRYAMTRHDNDLHEGNSWSDAEARETIAKALQDDFTPTRNHVARPYPF